MKAEKFDYQTHSEMVSKWPEKRDFPFPPQDALPDIGFMVEDAACGFLYTTNSKLAWVEWVVSNPGKAKEERKQALDTVFKLLEMTAKTLGFRILFSASAFAEYGAILERNGFEETDKNMTHFVKVLGGD